MLSRHISLLTVCVWPLLSVSLCCVPCRRQGDSGQSNNVDVSISSDRPPSGNNPWVLGPNKGAGEGRPRKRCCPYDFDSRKCTVVDDRVLCGFNKNAGLPQSKDTMLELKDGCRLRNGRLECGYVHPPFTNPRRPPPRPPVDGADTADEEEDIDEDDDLNDSKTKLKNNLKPYLDEGEDKKKQKKDDKTTPMTTKEKNQMANCVEVGGRIVCKEW